MALEVTLAVKVATLLYLQDTACIFTIKNLGPGPVTMPVPSMERSQPALHVTNVRSGAEQTLRRYVAPKGSRAAPGELPAGNSVEAGFSLSDFVPALDPGDYDLRVTWEFNEGRDRAQSTSVRLTVLPVTPKSLLTVPAVGGKGGVLFATWVNLLSQPAPSIVRAQISLRPGRTVNVLGRVTDCQASTRPVLSAPAAGQGLSSHWIAWVDGERFKFLHDGGDLGVSKLESVKLSGGDAEIVEPLYSSRVENETVRPPGAALLVFRGTDATRFAVQTVELAPGKATAGRAAALSGAKPTWMSAQFRTGGQKVVLFVQADGGRAILSVSAWRGVNGDGAGAIKLTDWRGKFISGGAMTDAKNVTHGGALLLVEDKGAVKPVFVDWSCSAFNEFKEVKRQDVEWPANMAITDASVAVNDSGKTAALLRDGAGRWHVFVDGKVQPVPPQFLQTQLPIQLGFLNGTGEPLLICGAVASSLNVVRLDGSNLPRRIEK